MDQSSEVWMTVPAQIELLNSLTPGKTSTRAQLDQHASKGTGFKYKLLLGKRVTTPEWIKEWLAGLLRDRLDTKRPTTGTGIDSTGAKAPSDTRGRRSLTRGRPAEVDTTPAAA